MDTNQKPDDLRRLKKSQKKPEIDQDQTDQRDTGDDSDDWTYRYSDWASI